MLGRGRTLVIGSRSVIEPKTSGANSERSLNAGYATPSPHASGA